MSTLTYPHYPGAKVAGASQSAAEAVAEHAPTLRERVEFILGFEGPMTTDEMAERLDVSVLSVRPRFSELMKLGRIEQTGERRTNGSGMTANVWRIKPTQPRTQGELF